MKRLAIVGLICVAASVASAEDRSFAERSRVLTSQSLAAVRVGMTLKEARAALGTALQYDPDDPGYPACGHAQRSDKQGEGVHYMVENGRITRIEIWPVAVDPASRTSTVTTTMGIGLGSSEDAIRRAYRSRLKVQSAPYDDAGHWFIVNDADKRHGIVFETSAGKVTSFWSGQYPALTYIEGCL